eukprot:scaffold106636_cov36-Phaeocystis_antarctica.AAC.1
MSSFETGLRSRFQWLYAARMRTSSTLVAPSAACSRATRRARHLPRKRESCWLQKWSEARLRSASECERARAVIQLSPAAAARRWG